MFYEWSDGTSDESVLLCLRPKSSEAKPEERCVTLTFQKWKRPWGQGWESLGVQTKKTWVYRTSRQNWLYEKLWFSDYFDAIMNPYQMNHNLAYWQYSLTSLLTACRQSFLDFLGSAGTNAKRVRHEARTKEGSHRLAIFPFPEIGNVTSPESFRSISAAISCLVYERGLLSRNNAIGW